MNKKLVIAIILVISLFTYKAGYDFAYAGSIAEASTITAISPESNVVSSTATASSSATSATLSKDINLNPYYNEISLVNFDFNSATAQSYYPMSEEERQQKKVDAGLDWANRTIQNFDGVPIFYQSASQLYLIGQKVNSFNKQLNKKYHLHLKADDSGAMASYRVKF